MQWLNYVLLTVASWGLYGVFLHSGQMAMNDPVLGRYKAFLFVGIAYFIFAVLAPLVLLKTNGSDFSFPAKGVWISLVAGTLVVVGVAGAGVLLTQDTRASLESYADATLLAQATTLSTQLEDRSLTTEGASAWAAGLGARPDRPASAPAVWPQCWPRAYPSPDRSITLRGFCCR